MRALPVLLLVAGCPNHLPEVCGLPTELPAVEAGFGSAERSDGASFTRQSASWRPGASASLEVGLLSFNMPFDEFGVAIDQLIADNAFPICVRLGAQDERTGLANFVEGGFVTDATHTGGLALLKLEDNALIGRFEADLANPRNETLGFADGVFHANRRN